MGTDVQGAKPEGDPAVFAPSGPSLSDRAAAGAGFMAAQMILTRVVGFVCNLALVHLLAKEYFGLFAMASTVAAVAILVQQFGLREVLIRRQSSYRHFANAAFWLSVITGFVCGGLMIALMPAAVWYYGEPKLGGLLLILALSVPIGSLSAVPEARLSIDLRFKWLSTLNSVSALGTVLLTLAFAAMGMKEYSFVLPRLVMAIVRTCMAFAISGFRPTLRVQHRRWKYLVGDSVWALFSNIAMTVVLQADVTMLGRFVAATALGVYTFSLQLSIQVMVLLALSLGQVLMPALAKLSSNPGRQADAALRAARMLGMIIVPTFLLQAAAIEPLVRLVFPAKWHDAIPILQILSLGMAGRFFGQPTQSLFQSQGRFREYFFVTLFWAASLVGAIGVAIHLAWPAGVQIADATIEQQTRIAVAVALALSCWGVIVEPLSFLLALRPAGRGVADVLPIVLRPMGLGIIGVGLGYFAMGLVPESIVSARIYHILRLFVLGIVATPLIGAGMFVLMRPTLDDLLERIGPMLGALGVRRRAKAAPA